MTLDLRPKRYCVRCGEHHAADDWQASCERYYGSSPIRHCGVCGGWHPLDMWSGNCMPPQNDARSDLAGPMIISDSLESIGGLNGVKSMADGRLYTSKSKLRAEYRAHGVTEMGNDKAKPFNRRKVTRADVRPAVERAFSQAGLGAR